MDDNDIILCNLMNENEQLIFGNRNNYFRKQIIIKSDDYFLEE